ncbi:MAG: hypothetical protein ACUVUG_05815 [Candidatus Aminicenantia bacterium]
MSLKKGFSQLFSKFFPWLKDLKIEEEFPILSTLLLDRRFKIPELLKIIEEDIGLGLYEGGELSIDGSLIPLIPKDIALSYGIIPLRKEGEKIVIGVSFNTSAKILRAIEELIEKKVKPVYLPTKPIKEAIEKHYEDIDIMDKILTISDDRRGIIPIKINGLKVDSSSEDRLRSIIAEAIKKRARKIDFISTEEGFEVWIYGEKGREKIATLQESIFDLILKKIAFYANLHYKEILQPFSKRVKMLIENKIFYLNITNFPGINSSILTLEIWNPTTFSMEISETIKSIREALSVIEGLIKNRKGALLLISEERPLYKSFIYELLFLLRREYRLKKIISVEREILSYVPYINQHYYEPPFSPLLKILNKALEIQPDIAFVELEENRDLKSVLVQSSRAFLIIKLPFTRLEELQDFIREAKLLSAIKAGVINGVFIAKFFKRVCPNCNEEIEIPEELRGTGLEGKAKMNKGCYLCTGEMSPSVFIADFIPLSKETPDQILFARSRVSSLALEKLKAGVIELESFIDYLLKNQEYHLA